jgi:Ribbon-helix-helix domain
VLQLLSMSNTFTIRLPEDLLEWLKGTSRRTGVPMGRLIREQLETAKSQDGKQRFMRHAGTFSGPPDLSSRKGYSRR